MVATVDDGSATYYNPAGLANIKEHQFDLSASVYALRFYHESAFLHTVGGASRDASVTEFVTAPTAITYVRQLADDVSLGLGYFLPQTENFLLRESLSASESGLDSTWTFDARSSTAEYWFSGGLGFHLAPNVRFGVAVHAIYAQETLSSSLLGSVAQGGLVEKVIQSSSFSTSTRFSAEIGLGLQVDLTDALVVGVSVRSPRLALYESDDESTTGVVGASNGLVTGLGAFTDRPTSSSASFGFEALGRYNAGLSYAAGLATLSAEFDLQPGYTSRGLEVDTSFTWNARAGCMLDFDPALAIGVGAFTDRGPETVRPGDPLVTRTHFYGGTAGVEVRDILRLLGDTSEERLTLSTVFAFRYAYGSGIAAAFEVSPAAPVDGLIGVSRSDLTIHEFSLHVGSSIRF